MQTTSASTSEFLLSRGRKPGLLSSQHCRGVGGSPVWVTVVASPGPGTGRVNDTQSRLRNWRGRFSSSVGGSVPCSPPRKTRSRPERPSTSGYPTRPKGASPTSFPRMASTRTLSWCWSTPFTLRYSAALAKPRGDFSPQLPLLSHRWACVC